MRRNDLSILFAGISTAAVLTACGSSGSGAPTGSPGADSRPAVSSPLTDPSTSPSDRTTPTGIGPGSEATSETVAEQGALTVSIGTTQFSATPADTATARAFGRRLPLTLDMADVNGNEKAFELADALPAEPANPGTIRSGDLMLYGSDTIVLFYESFETSYAYTRIGRLDTPDGLEEVVGTGDVTVTFAHP